MSDEDSRSSTNSSSSSSSTHHQDSNTPKKRESKASMNKSSKLLCTSAKSAGPKGDNIYEWRVHHPRPPPGSAYEGGVFLPRHCLHTRLPLQTSQGQLESCSHHLKVLLSICSLLTDCNPADPLVGSIATQFTTNRVEHDRIAKQWTKRYAT
ncbi:hypothetical protein KUCAC02_010838 [Chaenocephalus aceratus]|uniref:Uncharacterized protein n=1 Tax=Chaenocephalus aceratus TaxID=36190 RepID=A0ACB9WUQ5_CHAAC|nr:hypothetical protein KUCAC02_010838 [Chaenocephalus aceratus]